MPDTCIIAVKKGGAPSESSSPPVVQVSGELQFAPVPHDLQSQELLEAIALRVATEPGSRAESDDLNAAEGSTQFEAKSPSASRWCATDGSTPRPLATGS